MLSATVIMPRQDWHVRNNARRLDKDFACCLCCLDFLHIIQVARRSIRLPGSQVECSLGWMTFRAGTAVILSGL
jgi:hypothetical protein